jgi:hypothetical protein
MRADDYYKVPINVMLRVMVWEKGHAVAGEDASVWRRDDAGNLIRFDQYGDRDALWGWEIDHVTPQRLGGSDSLANLRPLRCATNASLGARLGQAINRRHD